jgi:hypothetical protein
MIILGFLATWLGVWAVITWPLFKKFQWRPFTVIAPAKKLALLLPLYFLAPFVVWAANIFLDISWQEIGISLDARPWRSFWAGLGIAIAGLVLLLFLKKGLRLISLDSDQTSPAAALTSTQKGLTLVGLGALAVWIGAIEELVFRGWMETQLEGVFIPWLAAALGSLIFAIAHLVWEGRPGLWQQPGLWLLGYVLVIARWADNDSLALAWGLHAGWVWGLACIEEFWHPQAVESKPAWLTGRTAQPLTSVLDLGLLGLTAGLVGWLF